LLKPHWRFFVSVDFRMCHGVGEVVSPSLTDGEYDIVVSIPGHAGERPRETVTTTLCSSTLIVLAEPDAPSAVVT